MRVTENVSSCAWRIPLTLPVNGSFTITSSVLSVSSVVEPVPSNATWIIGATNERPVHPLVRISIPFSPQRTQRNQSLKR